ncbi:16S rRNA (adenine(1518)-N(6)/adenine(1519)-N(6))-dimethyltransferase RsmA [Phytomonospora sp. NPDC050363]|uniref:16S rRNA (adenine(1518)-N(6)/adenine(1519)-N(6))- dimethyltransferase RsmA n=1 Tax=Phytomonospora sp. NPDC050363 TaxID=3155642 RepID=UPI0033EB38D4
MSELLGASTIRALAKALDVRPTKTLGQNFVIDANTVRRIAAAAKLDPGDTVIEVGPGLGSLTLALLPLCTHLHAVEIDPRLARALPETIRVHAPTDAPKLQIHTADAMRVTRDEIGRPAPTALVANLPYNVAVPVVLHLLSELPTLDHGLVMVQSEVADRLCAPPGNKTYGIPSAKLAWYATARRAGPVPRGVFWPIPNVDSGLVAFTRHEPPTGDRDATFKVIDAAFAQRRKTLRSALATWAGNPNNAADILTTAGVDPTARGEALTIEQFAAIAAAKPTGDRP